MIWNLLFIGLIVALVYLSGFWDNLDGYISKKFRFHHLPHILTCALCQCWWLSLLYITLTGNLTLFNIVLCLINAHLTKIYIPLWTLIENLLLKIIELMNKILW